MRFKKLAMTAVCAAIGISASPIACRGADNDVSLSGLRHADAPVAGMAGLRRQRHIGRWYARRHVHGRLNHVGHHRRQHIPSTASNIEAGYSNYSPGGSPVNTAFQR